MWAFWRAERRTTAGLPGEDALNGNRNALISLVIVILLGAGVAWAGSQGGATIGGVPVFALAVALAFVVQWVVFIPSYLKQTERFFDLTGSLTYITVTLITLAATGTFDLRSVLLATLVVVWAARLGTFLFRRVRRAGKDSRFDDIKPSFVRFLNVWTIQGLWVTLTAGAALASISSAKNLPIDEWAVLGKLVWLTGFVFEVVADHQKNRFREDPANKGTFIRTGLWSWSRHPNYFGEIVLWTGIAIVAAPTLAGWQLVTLISPVFVFLLLTRVSGIPLLEKKADATWGGQPEYEAYKAATSVLFPLPPKSV